MAYKKTIWEGREGSQLNRFGKEQETSSSVILSNQPKNVTKKGTPFSIDNMNNIEDGIEAAHELIEAQTQDLARHKTDGTAHEDIRQKISTEIQTRENADNSLRENITAEAQTREAAVQNLNGNLNTTNENLNNLQQDFNAWIGRGGYLDAYDFGRALSMHDPADQQALTDYALSQIPSLQNDPARIWNGTKITNLFNGHTFILTNTQDTDPTIFEWTDQGPSTIAPFDTDTGGFIIGAGSQDPDGTIERVPGSGGKGRAKGFAGIVEKIAELFDKKLDSATRGAASGVAPLDSNKRLPAVNLTTNIPITNLENVSLTAETGTGTDVNTPAITNAPLNSALQTIWAKIRQIGNRAINSLALGNLTGQPTPAVGQAASSGSATTAAKSDHYHALPSKLQIANAMFPNWSLLSSNLMTSNDFTYTVPANTVGFILLHMHSSYSIKQVYMNGKLIVETSNSNINDVISVSLFIPVKGSDYIRAVNGGSYVFNNMRFIPCGE